MLFSESRLERACARRFEDHQAAERVVTIAFEHYAQTARAIIQNGTGLVTAENLAEVAADLVRCHTAYVEALQEFDAECTALRAFCDSILASRVPQSSEANLFEMTEETYARALEGGRFVLPPGWWVMRDDGPEGPYANEAEAQAYAGQTT
jgi:hypothetical protein